VPHVAILMRQNLHSLLEERANKSLSTHSKGLFNNCASTLACIEKEDRAANRASMTCAIPRQFID